MVINKYNKQKFFESMGKVLSPYARKA